MIAITDKPLPRYVCALSGCNMAFHSVI